MSLHDSSYEELEITNKKGLFIVNWSIHHPIGISLIMLSLMVFGLFSLNRLGISLLPDIIYPDIRVRILDPGVSAQQMEDKVTRQLEEQLAITQDVTSIRSHSSTGRSAVDLSFPYGTDIDAALQDASSRLDRAKRFLPDTISPAVIYKRDPSQIPVMEFIVNSESLSPIELTQWVEKQLSKWFINSPGVASVEVGGGAEREVKLILKPQNLFTQQLNTQLLSQQIHLANQDLSSGLLTTKEQEFSTKLKAKITTLDELKQLPISLPITNKASTTFTDDHSTSYQLPLNHFVYIRDGQEQQRLSIRLNDRSGIKLSIQKQPTANTIDVVYHLKKQLQTLNEQKLIPQGVRVNLVSDQSTFVQYALQNATLAALSGLMLATIVVFIFLRDWRKTLIIASALPLAISLTFVLMDFLNLSLNIMTLGGLALGIGLLVDNTIIMLENISRHLSSTKLINTIKKEHLFKAQMAASEISSALVASTSTNLVAVLPFLFIGGLSGLLFEDLIITIAVSIFASLIVAMTLVPSYAARLHQHKKTATSLPLAFIARPYKALLTFLLKHSILTLFSFTFLLAMAWFNIDNQSDKLKHIFLPSIDEGRVTIGLKGEVGMKVSEMNQVISQIEQVLYDDPLVDKVFTTVGGFIFGRSEYERSNRGTIKVHLSNTKSSIKQIIENIFNFSDENKVKHHNNPLKEAKNKLSSKAWIKKIRKKINQLNLVGVKASFRTDGIRGVRFGNNKEEIELRIQGSDINQLTLLGQQLIKHLKQDEFLSTQLKNLSHTYDDFRQEIQITPNREKLQYFGISLEEIAFAIKLATDGVKISDFSDGDETLPIKLYLPLEKTQSINALEKLVVKFHHNQAVYLGDISSLSLSISPVSIEREQQQRINEVSASLLDNELINQVQEAIIKHLRTFKLPNTYSIYLSGNHELIKKNKQQSLLLMSLAIFLVFVVMAIQYESLRNPLIILFAIPFAYTSILFMVEITALPISMSLWLGVIMLTGIIVNNAIVLVEQIDRKVAIENDFKEAIIIASQQRLRPILMTTLSTVFGLMPLALGMGSGTEILQPLAIVIVWGLSYSLLVSLLLVPCIYRLFYFNR